ncbi:putative reverse transcriptase domain-containing protein [Tanacetum coccineum]
MDQIWVPLKGEVRTLIMDEAHKPKYSVHPGADKMYYDLRDRYWWLEMKKDIAEYSKPRALGTRLDINTIYHPRLMVRGVYKFKLLEDIALEASCPGLSGGSWDVYLPLVEFSYNNSYHSSMRCAPFEALYGRKIKVRLKAARDHKNMLYDKRRKPLEYSVEPVEIWEREFKKLKRSRIAIVKVRWNSKRGPEFTWERKDQMKLKYPRKLTLMVRNPCVWHVPMNKMAGTPLGEMADQTIMGTIHNSDHAAFASGYSCGGSLKASDNSALVSPTPIINMSRAGNHEELLSGMTNNMHEVAVDALVLLWLKNLIVDESPIVQSVSIQDKPGSYIAAAGGSRPKPSATGGSKLDLTCYVRLLYLLNVWGRSSFARCLIEINAKDILKESLTIGVHLIEDTGFTIKTVLIPITVVTPVVHAPIVEMTNDGF